MKLTKALKEWLSKNCNVPAEASNDDFLKAATLALTEGKLTTEKLYELSKESTEQASVGQKMLELMEKQNKALEAMSADIKTLKTGTSA